MRKLTTSLDNILDLINCAETYGFDSDMLFDSFAEILEHKLNQEEIQLFAKAIAALPGYGEEDYTSAKERLTEFKEKYIKYDN